MILKVGAISFDENQNSFIPFDRPSFNSIDRGDEPSANTMFIRIR